MAAPPIDYAVLDGLEGHAEVLASDASDHLPLVVRIDTHSQFVAELPRHRS